MCAPEVAAKPKTEQDAPLKPDESVRVNGLPSDWTPEMRRAMNRIILAGCLAFVYMQFTGGSPRVQFLRDIGTTEFQFGVIGAVPPLMLLFQFISAIWSSRLRRRKHLWIPIMVLNRALIIPFALLPWLIPDASSSAMVWGMIGILACSQGLGNAGIPMWFSWMGDLLPHRNLNEFWAARRRWMALSQGISMLIASLFFWYFANSDIRITYVVVAIIGGIAGIWDILLFFKVPEPEGKTTTVPGRWLIGAPFRDREFRGFIFYSAWLTFSLMFAAPFFQLYLLQVMGLPVFAVMLLFFFHAMGGALFTKRFGMLADKKGQRPVIVLCTALKSLVAIGFFTVQPGWWVLMMIPIFLIDNMMNTGLMVSRNGYMLKQSPEKSRSMYVAAVLACSGVGGAVGSITGGWLLDSFEGFQASWWFMNFTHFHIVFAIGIVLRWSCIPTAFLIKERESESPGTVWFEVIGPALLRWLRYPVGFFSRRNNGR